MSPGLLSSCVHLHSLHLRMCSVAFPDNVLVGLPASLRSLSILYKKGRFSLAGLETAMGNLEEFHLLEPAYPVDRGFRSALIANLGDIRRLSIGPWTVADLDAELNSLQHLTELAVVTCNDYDILLASKVLAFIGRASALCKLAVSSQLRSHWSEDEVDAIKAVALEHDVELGNADYAWKLGPGEWSAIACYDGQGW